VLSLEPERSNAVHSVIPLFARVLLSAMFLIEYVLLKVLMMKNALLDSVLAATRTRGLSGWATASRRKVIVRGLIVTSLALASGCAVEPLDGGYYYGDGYYGGGYYGGLYAAGPHDFGHFHGGLHHGFPGGFHGGHAGGLHVAHGGGFHGGGGHGGGGHGGGGHR
jgi:hypothetical protein